AQWQLDLEQRLPQWQQLEEKLAVINEQLHTAEHHSEDTLMAWERFQQEASQQQRDTEILQSRIQYWEESIARLHHRAERLAKEQGELNSDGLMREVAELEALCHGKEEQKYAAE